MMSTLNNGLLWFSDVNLWGVGFGFGSCLFFFL